MISPQAFVHPNAKIGNNVTVSPFAYIDDNVEIGDNTWIGPNATIFSHSRIGKNVKVFSGAVIGAVPQDLKFKGEDALAEVGDNTVIRECVTINRGTADKMTTRVGKNCLIMAYAHIAHDCILGDHIIIANSVQISGHVTIQDWAIVEGMVGIQQFVTVGAHTFIGGSTGVRKSVPPFVRAAREPLQYIGVNSVGLQRRGFSQESIRHIEDIYRIIFVRGFNLTKAIETVEAEIADTPEKNLILGFIRTEKEKDGIIKGL